MQSHPFPQRLQKLQAELDRRGLSGAIITDANDFFYLTGVHPNPSFPAILVMNKARAIAVTPRLGMDPSPMTTGDPPIHVIRYANLAMADLDRYIDEETERENALMEAARDLGIAGAPLGVEISGLPQGLAHLLGLSAEKTEDIGTYLYTQRIIKDAWEQDQLAYAVRLNDIGFAAAQRTLRAGVTDMEAYSQAWLAMASELGQPFHLRGEFSGGPEISGRGGSAPLGRTMQEGDILIADIYPVIRGYAADTTRNFVIGPPQPWQSEMHAILEEALAKGQEAIRPGLPATELDRIVRGHVEAHAPKGALMHHHCGHGIGIGAGRATHYPPFIVPQSKDILEESMVLTLEPGLYISGKGGMRLEDNFVVAAQGCRALGTFPKKLAVCG